MPYGRGGHSLGSGGVRRNSQPGSAVVSAQARFDACWTAAATRRRSVPLVRTSRRAKAATGGEVPMAEAASSQIHSQPGQIPPADSVANSVATACAVHSRPKGRIFAKPAATRPSHRMSGSLWAASGLAK